jgi:hypothetical protein
VGLPVACWLAPFFEAAADVACSEEMKLAGNSLQLPAVLLPVASGW